VYRSPDVVGLTSACSMAAELHPDISIAFIVCGSAVTARAMRSAALAYPAAVAVVFVRCNPESVPAMRTLGEVRVLTIALLDDLRHLMLARAQS
jgi:hypothetical protein